MIIAHLSSYFYRQKARFFLTPMSYLRPAFPLELPASLEQAGTACLP
jgi:hypothetical protein